MKYTLLSKWTVLILTVVTVVVSYLGIGLLSGGGLLHMSNPPLGVIAVLVALVIYALAFLVALFDSIQERRWGWLVILVLLFPFAIGPVFYSVFGPKNTK